MTEAANHEALRARWRLLLPAAEGARGRAAFDALAAAYGSAGRHYHTLEHIGALLAHVEREASRFGDRATVELAILYHDAVYEIDRKDNEEASARLARQELGRLGVPPGQCEKVAAFIRATAHLNAQPMVEDHDLARFLDLDLSVLAAAPETYDRYARAIRREYARYSDASYRAGRCKVLATFLARERLFLCADHHAEWDRPARANLLREAGELGCLPGSP